MAITGRGGGSFAYHRTKSNAFFHFGPSWHVYFGDAIHSPADRTHRIVVLVAKKEIASDQEIFVCYGRATQPRLGICDAFPADSAGEEVEEAGPAVDTDCDEFE